MIANKKAIEDANILKNHGSKILELGHKTYCSIAGDIHRLHKKQAEIGKDVPLDVGDT